MATPPNIPEWLTADREWLSTQPGMTPWVLAASRVLTRLTSWIERYRTDLGLTNSLPGCKPKLWKCWAHHWRTAIEKHAIPVDGFQVADQIEAGRGFRRSGNLGGNVIRDVILGDAMLRKENAAIRRFESECKDTIARQVEAVRRFARDDAGWWNDLLAELVGVHRADREGRLARFSGQSGLIPWTVTVAIRFLTDRVSGVKQHESIDPEQGDPKLGMDGAIRSAISADCVELLAKQIRAGLASLRPRERLALRLLAVDRLQGQQIAAVFGINPGNVSRLLQAARDALWAQMTADDGRAAEHQDCFDALVESGGDKTLADALRTALEETTQERLA